MWYQNILMENFQQWNGMNLNLIQVRILLSISRWIPINNRLSLFFINIHEASKMMKKWLQHLVWHGMRKALVSSLGRSSINQDSEPGPLVYCAMHRFNHWAIVTLHTDRQPNTRHQTPEVCSAEQVLRSACQNLCCRFRKFGENFRIFGEHLLC